MTWSGEQRAFVVCHHMTFFYGATLKTTSTDNRPKTIDDLKIAISREVAKIPKDMTQRVMTTFWSRLRQCVASGGRHLDCIISKN